jgi:Ca2+-transporting ATPase
MYKPERQGLSSAEAAERSSQFGFNELPSSKPRSTFRIALGVLREPMLLLLLACGITYLWLGSEQEALILLVFVVMVIFTTLYQERKTERALEALRDLSSPRALVIRDGKRQRIAGRDVVPGDLMVLAEGDRIAADGVLYAASNLSTDESLLTGESVPVRKQAVETDLAMKSPGGDDLPFVFSGTLVVRGSGLVVAKSTGILTEIGKIGKSLREVEQEPTLVERDTRQMVKRLATGAVLLCGFLAVFYGLTRGDWLQGVLSSLTLAMAILPEELPVVMTVFLALGAWRMSKNKVLTRRTAAIEMLGACTVLCVDKTGTLTMNQMAVSRLFVDGEGVEPAASIPEKFHELVEFSMLASQVDPFDPMDKAIRKTGDEVLRGSEHLHGDWTAVREYPLSKELLAISEVWASSGAQEFVIATKGAPEAVGELCHLSTEATAQLNANVAQMAEEGLRVLGVAKSKVGKPDLPVNVHDLDFQFLGLVALRDPVRPEVAGAITECQAAGIRVVMITGDNPGTALSIGRQIGLDVGGGAITGPELTALDLEGLRKRVVGTNVFARAVPDQKLQLVRALQANREIVAMTGDGVNDAPALKASQIGIAMGLRGTDVAREASDLVLLEDDFTSIVKAVGLGRRIFDNLKKAMAYTFAIHVPIAGLSLCAVIFRWPLILEPVHVAFLELIIDPACSVVFEAEPAEANLMQRPPRDANEHLFQTSAVVMSILQGFGILVILLCIFGVALYRGQTSNDARALTFASLVLANVALIVTNRSWSLSLIGILKQPNAAMWWVVGGAIVFLGLVLYVPMLRSLFHFSTLHLDDVALCIAAGFASLGWLEALKAYRRRSDVAVSLEPRII